MLSLACQQSRPGDHQPCLGYCLLLPQGLLIIQGKPQIYDRCRVRERGKMISKAIVRNQIKIVRSLGFNEMDQQEKNKLKFNNTYTPCIHGRDPRKLSNQPKWYMPHLKYQLQLKTKEDVGGGESLMKVTRKNTVKRAWLLRSFKSQHSPFTDSEERPDTVKETSLQLEISLQCKCRYKG